MLLYSNLSPGLKRSFWGSDALISATDKFAAGDAKEIAIFSYLVVDMGWQEKYDDKLLIFTLTTWSKINLSRFSFRKCE
jgi:hypothetical protein